MELRCFPETHIWLSFREIHFVPFPKQLSKKRIGPDLLLMEDCYPAPSAYDLDIRKPPRCIIETTSPKSHFKDLRANVPFYFGLGVLILSLMRLLPKRNCGIQLNSICGENPKGNPFRKSPPIVPVILSCRK